MINPEPPSIQLDQFLKVCGIPTGGQAKMLIQNGEVKVNGKIENRRRRKLIPGDEVDFGDDVFVVGQEPTEDENQKMLEFECIDIGANLTHKSFSSDLDEVTRTAQSEGVAQIVLTGTCRKSNQLASDLCLKHPGYFYCTAGIHPHDASTFDKQTQSEMIDLLGYSHVVAVGECGLDFNRNFSPPQDQIECFRRQLELAADIQKPLFLHERDAHDQFATMLREYRAAIGKGVVHCFTGSEAELVAYLEMDLHIGITGWICDERRGLHLRELVKQIPADRLMIETDSPYLAPRDIRPKVQRNEPKYLPHILRCIAECRGESAADFAAAINQTTRDFFSI